MEKLSSITGKLQTDLVGLFNYIGVHTNVAGNITLSIAEASTLRSYIEAFQKNIDSLKSIITELDNNINRPTDDLHKLKANTETGLNGNMVNHPTHYQSSKINGKSIECIDAMEAVKGWYSTALFCELNAFKYNWRLGNKDNVITEIGKIKWYSGKASELWRENLKWFYPKNQHTYAIIDEKVKMKDPTTGEWGEAVLYTDGMGTYVRDKVSFIDKFKKA